MIRWLHISDLHFNDDPSKDDISTSMLREELPIFINNKGFHFDYIFCTGDVRVAPQPFPDRAAHYLRNLCKTTQTPIENLFIVPGNHDVDRLVPGRDAVIHSICYNRSGYYDPKYGEIHDEDLQCISKGLDEFRDFLSKVYVDVPGRMDYYKKPLAPHFNIETSDFNILHVDTTLTNTTGQEAYDMIIGTKCLQNALGAINEEKPTILITHFPYTSLLQDEKKYVGELLYRKGVRMWLAGHEHDHILQRYHYLDSIQAGELKMEERANATVLIGEYDSDTLSGTISAYTWFTEGWARYPIIDHNGLREDEYSFTLRLPQNNGRSREAVRADEVNKEFFDRLPENIIPELFPEIVISDKETFDQDNVSKLQADAENRNGLMDILSVAWITSDPHIILIADGGMGKTTLFLDACRKEISPALYVSAERLSAIGYGIKDYCARVLFDGDKNRFNNFAAKRYNNPSLILFIDGLNEVNSSTERAFINEIKALNLLKGLQIVVSSRSDFTSRYSMSGYKVCRLQALSDDKIEKLFTSEEWGYIRDKATLHKLLSNPMMVTMYKEVSPIITKYKAVEFLHWSETIDNATDLLKDYYIAQIAVMLGREGISGEHILSIFQIVSDILPLIGYAFESSHRMNMKVSEFRKILKDILQNYEADENALEPVEEYLRIYDVDDLKSGPAHDFIVNEMHLLYQDAELVSFPHQIYRDFLSAEFIARNRDNIDSVWNTRGIPFPVMTHIRNLTGKYWEKDGLASIVHQAGQGRDDAFDLIGNLLDCFPSTDNGGCADYSGLNLCGLRLPDIKKSKALISLRDAQIDETSIGNNDSRPGNYESLIFSHDNRYLAGVSDRKLYIYELGESQEPFVYRTGKVRKLTFANGYLFAVTSHLMGDRVVVFSSDDGAWTYNGEISGTDHWNLFNRRFRFNVLKDDMLYFYYNNREHAYRLSDCELIKNRQVKHTWEDPVEGLRIKLGNEGEKKNKSVKREGISSTCTSSGLTAVGYKDGGLVVKSGNETQYVLQRGITLLKDGSISGDGTRAATLSSGLFELGRRIQIWDLNAKSKVKEIFCPQEIGRIHMSETGEWIFGETEESTWVLNVETDNSQWYNEHFISNQREKRTSYGDKVLRKNENNDLYLFDLRTHNKSELENPCKNARIASFMPDGSVVVVGNNARKLKFKNSRTGTYSEIDTKGSVILGIQCLPNQPFIAVATDDGLISIYHTGTCQRTRKIETNAGNYMMVIHPECDVVTNSSGGKRFETHNYFEYEAHGQKRGRWYSNPYGEKDDPAVNGDVLDLAFNTAIHELVVILSNGQIMFCHEKYCRYHSKIQIITAFNVNAYDFRGCICSGKIKEELMQNGAVV